MKKIMTNIRTLAALLIASGTFAACSSDDNTIDLQPAQPAGQQVYTMTIQATKSTGDEANARVATRALALGGEDNKTLNATWATTENIFVKKGSDWATGSLQPDANAATATLKGSLSDITIAKDDVLTLQFPRSGELDYTGQVGTLEDIAAKYDYATATVQVASVSATGNIIPTEATTTFQNQQAIVNFTLVDKADGTTPLNATELIVSDGTNTYTVTPASATSEIYVAIPGIASQTVTLTATVGSDTYTYEKSNVTFVNGKYYRVGVKMTKQAAVPTGALSGQFTVDMDGGTPIKVYFSKGNLRYASGTWSFFDNQYDYYTSYSAGAWDKFGWSTSATTYGMNTSTSSIYSGDFVDWGATMGTGWYTLSSAEWTYLFNTRTVNGGTGSGKSYTLGQRVNNVLGVVLYPDGYTGAAYTTGSNWSTFESAGCVFLPAAGGRDGASVFDVGSFGYYWSSTAAGSGYAYGVRFLSGSVSPANSDYRRVGFSVRLVRPVE